MICIFHYVWLSLKIMYIVFIVLFLENIKVFYMLLFFKIYALKYWLIQTCINAWKQSNFLEVKWRHSRFFNCVKRLSALHLLWSNCTCRDKILKHFWFWSVPKNDENSKIYKRVKGVKEKLIRKLSFKREFL